MKIRICVAVDHEGHWYACGGSGMTDDEVKAYSVLGVPHRFAHVEFVEVDVSVPDAPGTIQGLSQ